MLKNLTGNHMVLCTVLVSVALIYFINNYSSSKGLVSEGNQNARPDQLGSDLGEEPSEPSNPGKGCQMVIIRHPVHQVTDMLQQVVWKQTNMASLHLVINRLVLTLHSFFLLVVIMLSQV